MLLLDVADEHEKGQAPMALTVADLRQKLDRFPRYPVAVLPTPLQECPRLSAYLGGPQIAVKRDDLTGLAFGGNKSRQLDFILGEAVRQEADALITAATVQSNQCRQTAAAAGKLGMSVHLLLKGTPPAMPEANLLLDYLFGADIRYLSPDATKDEVNAAVAALADELREAGQRPYIIDLLNDESFDNTLAALAYVGMVAELIDQLGGPANAPDWIYLSSGSGGSGTMAGIVAGCRALGLPTRVVGVSAAHLPESVRVDTLGIARRALAALGIDVPLDAEDVIVEHGFVGRGYGEPTDEGIEAMRLAARTEGLVLDPFYTAKALAALAAHCRQGVLGPTESAVFVHTGGLPLVFLHDLATLIAGTADGDAG